MGTLKLECIWQQRFATYDEAKAVITTWVKHDKESRPHPRLDYLRIRWKAADLSELLADAPLDSMARAILDVMLSVEFPGVAQLREQRSTLRVFARRGQWRDISIEVSSAAPKAIVLDDSPVELRWVIRSKSGAFLSMLILVLAVFEGYMNEITWLPIEYTSDNIPPLSDSRIFIREAANEGHYADGGPPEELG